MSNKISICFATDNGYAPYMGMAILSILTNAGKEENFHFYVLDNKISNENKKKVESLKKIRPFEITWLPLNEELFKDCNVKRSNWTLSIFGRYLIPQLITDDKVLYLDCDILVRGSLLALWQTNIEDYYLAGVPDYNVMYRGKIDTRFAGQLNAKEYVNSGVLLINNKKWREENLFKTLLDYSIQNAALLQWPDQDAINYICRGKKKLVSPRWNCMGYFYKPDLFLQAPDFDFILKERDAAVIRHFHPWEKNMFVPNRSEYIELMKDSPWADLVPQDDSETIAFWKKFFIYIWRHPFCFFLPKFYQRWYYRGTKCLFMDWA